MTQNFKITQSEAIKRVAEDLNGSIHMDEFVERVLELWPSTAKSRKSSIRQSIQTEALGKTLLLEDENTLLPIRNGMQGVRFRVPLTPKEVRRGLFSIGPAFEHYAIVGIPPEEYQLEDAKGNPISTRIRLKEETTKSIFGTHTVERSYFRLADWYKAQNANRTDSVIITILDWDKARYRLELEKKAKRKQKTKEIEAANQAVADHFFNMLENQGREYLFTRVGVSHAYAQLKQSNTVPDHWYEIIQQDPRMILHFDDIRYADDETFPFIDADITKPSPDEEALYKPVKGAQAEQVYQFKAQLMYQKKLWRRIEIQGGQTLRDLDLILKKAFEHSNWDHLSGFWKVVRRGKTKRFREIDLGNINPYEGDRADEIMIANLALTPEIRLKYVYDFGDWIEHQLILEDIKAPEENAKYPRITGQNKPKYQPCRVCQEKEKETTATWICYHCSNEFQEDFLLCDDCIADRAHEEHDADKILY